MLYKTLSGPITCQIEIDGHCNNNCIHCYNHWRHEKCNSSIKMDNITLQKIIEELVKSKIFQVTITGGEPLLNKDLLFEAINQLISNKIFCGINSNLTLLTSDDAKKLYSLGIRGIMTSFFSFNEDKFDFIAGRKGAFKDTLRGIFIAQNSGLTVSVSMVITKINKEDVIETARFLKTKGITQFFATKASPPLNSVNFQKYMITRDELVRTLDDLSSLEKHEEMKVGILECYPLCAYKKNIYHFARKRNCSAGITTCTISTNGDVRPCSHSDAVFGNINKNTLSEIWLKMLPLRGKNMLPPECISCNYLQKCTGGCRVDSRYCFGSSNSLDPYAIPKEADKIETRKDVTYVISERNLMLPASDIILRDEDEGVLIATHENPGEPVLMTVETFNLVFSFKKPFLLKDFTKKSGLNKKNAIVLCRMLIRDGLLEIIN